MSKDRKDFIDLVIRRMPPLDEWLESLNECYKFSTKELERIWQKAHRFARKAKDCLEEASKSFVNEESSARQATKALLLKLQDLLQDPAAGGSKNLAVTNVGIVLLYRHPRAPSTTLVDDVLVQDEEDTVLHTPKNLKWIKKEGQKNEGWTSKDLLLEEAAYSFHFPNPNPSSDKVPSIERSKFFEELSRIFHTKHADLITIHSFPRGVGVPFDSKTCSMTGMLFLLLDQTRLEDLPGLAAKAIVLFRMMEVAVGTETRTLINTIRQMNLKNTLRWEQREREKELVQFIRKTWNAEEISIVQKSGPFAVLCPDLSWPKLDRRYKYQQIWGQERPTDSQGQRLRGYLTYALAHDTAYYIPDVNGTVKREDGLVPEDVYDPLLPNVRSQYTTSYRYGNTFHAAINLGFSETCGLWAYQREIVDVLLETLGDLMYSVLWDETEYSVMSNASRVIRTLKDSALEYVEGKKNAKSRKRQRTKIIQLYSKIAEQFGSNRGSSGPGYTPTQETIIEKIVEFKQKEPEIDFAFEPRGEWQLKIEREEFNQILDNLLDNAVEAEGTLVRIDMRKKCWTYPDEINGVELAVADNGEEIDPDFEHKMFNRAESNKTHREDPVNIGLGLWTIDQLCRDYGFLLEYRRLELGPYRKEFAILFPERMLY